jgi:hypothetical protein
MAHRRSGAVADGPGTGHGSGPRSPGPSDPGTAQPLRSGPACRQSGGAWRLRPALPRRLPGRWWRFQPVPNPEVLPYCPGRLRRRSLRSRAGACRRLALRIGSTHRRQSLRRGRRRRGRGRANAGGGRVRRRSRPGACRGPRTTCRAGWRSYRRSTGCRHGDASRRRRGGLRGRSLSGRALAGGARRHCLRRCLRRRGGPGDGLRSACRAGWRCYRRTAGGRRGGLRGYSLSGRALAGGARRRCLWRCTRATSGGRAVRGGLLACAAGRTGNTCRGCGRRGLTARGGGLRRLCRAGRWNRGRRHRGDACRWGVGSSNFAGPAGRNISHPSALRRRDGLLDALARVGCCSGAEVAKRRDRPADAGMALRASLTPCGAHGLSQAAAALRTAERRRSAGGASANHARCHHARRRCGAACCQRRATGQHRRCLCRDLHGQVGEQH